MLLCPPMSSPHASRFANLSDPTKAALLIVFAGVLFSSMNAMIRHVSSELHPLEIVFFRSLFGFVAMMPWLSRCVGQSASAWWFLAMCRMRGPSREVR